MNSMKTFVLMCLLGAAGYCTYTYMKQKPELAAADPQAFSGPPSVQIPGLNSSPPQLASTTTNGPANPPAALLGPSSAPPPAANQSPFLSPSSPTSADPPVGNAPPSGSGVTLLTPPGQANTPVTPNAPPVASPPVSTPTLLVQKPPNRPRRVISRLMFPRLCPAQRLWTICPRASSPNSYKRCRKNWTKAACPKPIWR